ncbi:hypothetical protein MD484_g8080, partial [Candolleomyces efflorescens]
MDEHSFKLLQSVVRVAHNTHCSEAAALTFLLCDIASTFPDEVKYIWSKKWSFTKIMYLIARYYALLLAMVGSKFYVAVIDIICVTRIFALYGRNRKILALLALTSIVDVAVCSSSMLSSARAETVLAAFLLFTLYKLKDSMKDEFGNAKFNILQDRSLISPLLAAFVRDGTLFFLLIAGIMSLSAMMSFYRAGFYYNPTWPWLHATFSYAGCRLILNVHRAAARTTHMTDMGSVEPMEFANNASSHATRF